MRRIYTSRRLSKKYLLKLLTENPDLEVIEVPKSIYERTSKKVLEALKEAGVQVVPTGRGRGRPRKWGEEDIKRIKALIERGKKPSEVAKILGIPRRTVYYILSIWRQRMCSETTGCTERGKHPSGA